MLQPSLPQVPGRAAAQDRLGARAADLLPVGYFHLLSTPPAEIAGIAYQNKAAVYDLLFRAVAETLLTTPPIPSTSVPASAPSPCSVAGVRR